MKAIKTIKNILFKILFVKTFSNIEARQWANARSKSTVSAVKIYFHSIKYHGWNTTGFAFCEKEVVCLWLQSRMALYWTC